MLLSAKNKALHPGELRCDSNQLGTVIEYIKKYPNTRVNILLVEKDLEERLEHELSLLSKVTTNYTIACAKFSELRELLFKNIPAYFNFPVTDWETFTSLVEWGVTDILIDGPLGFQMDTIKSKKEKTLIRVCPHESPNAAISLSSNNENSFFIRPEDLALYRPFVDICEIRAEQKEKEEVLYNIYKRGTFSEDLSVLIPQLKVKVMNPLIRKEFVKNRLNCKQKCKAGNNYCKRCMSSLRVADELFNYFLQDKKSKLK